MKNFILSAFLLLSLSALADRIDPVGVNGEVFGLLSGTYQGTGVLDSRPFYVPSFKFTSKRTLTDGMFTAHTVARLLGQQVGEARARLKISPQSQGTFDVLDLDRGGLKVGQGECSDDTCQFEARVMNGELYLAEVWKINRDSFEIIEGFQILNGIESDYTAKFRPL